MPTFVVLLRGVNVGKAKRMPMETLRQLLTDLGFSGVRTLLYSGNAVFHAQGASAAVHAKAIAQALSDCLAFEVAVIVKSAKQLDAIVGENPFAEAVTDHSRQLVAFTQEERSLSALVSIETLVMPPESFVLGKYAA